jgi:hypothetical protein
VQESIPPHHFLQQQEPPSSFITLQATTMEILPSIALN